MPYFLHRPGVDLADLVVPIEELSRVQSLPYGPDYTSVQAAACCRHCLVQYWQQMDAFAEYRMSVEYPSVAPAVAYLGVYVTAQAAHAAKGALHSPDPLVVTFRASAEESESWRDRERYRDSIDQVPWVNDAWASTEAIRDHFAYLSVLKPGLVAYTPSEEWGVQDRQLRVRPGKYLAEFAPQLTKSQIDTYVAQIKAIDDRNVVKFATTADEIESVYRKGPESCMSHSLDSYASAVHPVRVYGDSDLSVAYLGDLASSGRKVRARALVWKARKLYSRVYGDETLKILLERDGYTLTPRTDYGNFAGAQIAAIHQDDYDGGDVWVMPYIDCTGFAVRSVNPDTRESFFTLLAHNASYSGRESREGVVSCRETNGTTNGDYSTDADYWCRHCGDNAVDEEGDVCESCSEDQRSCIRCEDEFFDSDPYWVGDDPICNGCYRRYTRICAACDERFITDHFTSRQTSYRSNNDLEAVCGDCQEDVMQKREEEAQEEAADTDTETERA